VKRLTFEGAGSAPRRVSFEERSWLPLSAACLVAGGIRETLGALLGMQLQTQLFEPGVPRVDGWKVIVLPALASAIAAELVYIRAQAAQALAGQVVTIEKGDITERGTRPQSMMPEGLLNAFTPAELANLLTWLESLKK